LNRLFVAYKPSGISSNRFLGQIKRRYGTKKAGYSGTLDPFAKGVLIVALGNHTRLFRFLNKVPKSYRATLWLGAHSDTLDIEAVTQIDAVKAVDIKKLRDAIASLQGDISYQPPIFSAKKINGQRAYSLAREGKAVELDTIHSTVYKIRMLHYCHPFVTFEATVSEGTYIRSLGKLICERLGLKYGALSALERLSEGQFRYNNEKAVDIRASLNIPRNTYFGDPENILYGKVLQREDFQITEAGRYWIDNAATVSIIEIAADEVKYVLNKVEIC
jgi:tRNA pseudouridine55 synthase